MGEIHPYHWASWSTECLGVHIYFMLFAGTEKATAFLFWCVHARKLTFSFQAILVENDSIRDVPVSCPKLLRSQDLQFQINQHYNIIATCLVFSAKSFLLKLLNNVSGEQVNSKPSGCLLRILLVSTGYSTPCYFFILPKKIKKKIGDRDLYRCKMTLCILSSLLLAALLLFKEQMLWVKKK